MSAPRASWAVYPLAAAARVSITSATDRDAGLVESRADGRPQRVTARVVLSCPGQFGWLAERPRSKRLYVPKNGRYELAGGWSCD